MRRPRRRTAAGACGRPAGGADRSPEQPSWTWSWPTRVMVAVARCADRSVFGSVAQKTNSSTPPETFSSIPVMYEARSEQRKAIAFAMSCGSPGRLNTVRLAIRSFIAAFAMWNASVPMIPGTIALAVIPCRPPSIASVFVSPRRPAFVVEYDAWPKPPSVPATDDMFTIRPHPRSFMCGHTACAQLNAPVRFTRRSRSHSSGDWFWSCATWSSVPALLTRMSTEPRSATARSTAARTCSRSVTSQRTASARRPRARISSAVDSVCTRPCCRATVASGPYASVSSESSDSTSRSAITTSAPARAKVSASARPRPREPPVTSATRPDRSISSAIAARPYSRLSLRRGRIGLMLGASPSRQEDLLRDHEPLDLRRSLVDLEQLRVAHQLLDRILPHVAVAAEDLNCVRCDLHRGVGREPLRERRLQRGAPPVVEHPRRLPRQE